MSVAPGAYELGPEHGTVQVKTYREGMAQSVGHDLVLDVTRWSALVVAGRDGIGSIRFEIDPDSLKVRDGLGGVRALTDKDRAEIERAIAEKILRGNEISFVSSSVTPGPDGVIEVRGELRLGSRSHQRSYSLLVGEGFITGTLPVIQTEHELDPYRTFLGTLRVRDQIDVCIDVRLPSSEPAS